MTLKTNQYKSYGKKINKGLAQKKSVNSTLGGRKTLNLEVVSLFAAELERGLGNINSMDIWYI